MRMKLTSVGHCFLAAGACFLLSACGSKTDATDQETVAPARPAKLLNVSLAGSDAFLNYPAIIKSGQLSVLAFEVAGRLAELSVVEAQHVEKGDVLAKLDQRDFQASLQAAQATFVNANEEYQRAVRLFAGDAISRSVLEQRKSQHDISKSQLNTAEKALQDSVLIAPFAGYIAKVSVKEREVIQAGSRAIDILGDGGLEATINLPSSIIARSGAQEGPATDSYIILDAAPGQQVPVAFKEASLEADAATQTYAITYTFDAPDGLIVLPGMNAVVWFRDPSQISAAINKVSIPITSVAIDGDQKYVWVVDKSSMAVSKRIVVVENGVGSSLNIVSGLKSGETIVSAGISSLSEGETVSEWVK